MGLELSVDEFEASVALNLAYIKDALDGIGNSLMGLEPYLDRP